MNENLKVKLDAARRIDGNEMMTNTELAQEMLCGRLMEFVDICIADCQDPRLVLARMLDAMPQLRT